MDKILSKSTISYFNDCLAKNKNNYANLFKTLKKKYKKLDLALIYNYILQTSDDNKLLNQTIREINVSKYIDNFSALLDFIVVSNDVNLRVLAIKTVALYKNTKALPILLDCLNNKNSNYKLRLASAEALGKIGDKKAFEALGYVAKDEQEKSAYVKESAVMALGMLGDNRAIDVFNSIMQSKNMFLDKFLYLKERIIESLAKFDVSKEKKAYEILKNSLTDDNIKIRISAIEALMNSEIDEAWDLIYERLKNDVDIEVQKNALVALYNISDRNILDEVANATGGEFNNELKNYALRLIKEYEDD